MNPAEGFPAEPLDPQIQLLVDNLPGGISLPVGTDPVKAREQFRRITVALRDQQPAADLAEIRDITVPGATGDLEGRVFVPRGDAPAATILFFHGGGFIVGDIDTHELQTRAIAERTGMQVVSVNYRLAPEDPFPAAADDAESIATWLTGNIGEFGGDGRVLVMGDSAGGNLSAVCAQNVAGISGQVLVYPTVDFSVQRPAVEEHADGPLLTAEAGRVFHGAYLGGGDAADPRISPLLGEDFGNQPPAVVITCEYDILRDDGIAYARKLREHGVAVTHLHFPSLMHGFMGFYPMSTGCDAALTDICDATVALAAC